MKDKGTPTRREEKKRKDQLVRGRREEEAWGQAQIGKEKKNKKGTSSQVGRVLVLQVIEVFAPEHMARSATEI